MLDLTVSEIREQLRSADEETFAVLERSLMADERKGVKEALDVARRRIQQESAEKQRIKALYDYQDELASKQGAHVVVGLDEVGRGPIAGPLAVGAVVLAPDTPLLAIPHLNDSKQLSAAQREEAAKAIKKQAVAWTVEYVVPEDIDRLGMTQALTKAFTEAIASIERQGVEPDLVLLDGNALHLDKREVNVVKGDARCASIAAASIVAKVERDGLMELYDRQYPRYRFAANKGYASPEHIAAIRAHGLSPIHRRTFCESLIQPTLF